MSVSNQNRQDPQHRMHDSVNPGARSSILFVTTATAGAAPREPLLHLPTHRFDLFIATDRAEGQTLLREQGIRGIVADLVSGTAAETLPLARRLCDEEALPLLLLVDPTRKLPREAVEAVVSDSRDGERSAYYAILPEGANEELLAAVVDNALRLHCTAAAETAEQEARVFMNAIMESAQEGISVLDADLTIRRTDRKMQEWYAPSMPLEGKKCYEAFHGRSTPCPRCPTLRSMRTGNLERELVKGHPDSPVEYVELFSYPVKDKRTGEVTGVVEFVRDITEQRRTEERLRRSKESAEQYLSVAATIILALKPDGTITLLNDSGHSLLGYEPGELIGANWYETAVPERYRAEVREVLEGLGAGRNLGPTHENPVVTRSGEERTILWHNTVMTRDDGEEGYTILSSGEDITEKMRMEARMERRLAYEQAVTAASRVLVEPRGDLREALKHLRSATGTGRAYVFRNSRGDDGELTMSQIAEVCAAGVTPHIDNPELQNLPYRSLDPAQHDALSRGRAFIRRVEDIREQDRPFFESQEILQLVLIPVEGGGEWIGFLGFDVCDEPRRWEQEDLDLLGSAAAMIGNTLVRREAEEELASHLEFQEVVAEVSGNFIRSMGSGIDGAVDYLLQRVGQYFDADRAYVFRINHGNGTVSNTHEWCRPGTTPQKQALQEITLSSISHILDPLCRGEVVSIPDVTQLPPEAEREREHLLAQDIRSLLNIPFSSQGTVTGMLGFDSNRVQRTWTSRQIRLTRVIADILAGAIETQRAIDALDAERRLMEILLKTSPDYIFFKDASGRYTRVSDSMARALAVSDPSEAVGKVAADFYDPHLAAEIEAGEAEVLRTGTPVIAAEEHVAWPDGTTRWVSLTKVPIYDTQSGAITGTFSITRDITERKEAEEEIQGLLEEKELLLREVHHRVKNNMHSMESLLSLQAQMVENPDASAALEEARSRLQAMEVLYEKLYRSGNVLTVSAREYLSSLIDEVVRLTSAAADVGVTADIPDVHLPVRTLSTLGLLVNELVTNSLKHAFPDGSGGTISVTLEINADVLLHYRDSGIGVPDDVISGTSAGLGMVLIRSLTQQLEGTMEIFRQAGTHVELRFPHRIAELPTHAKRRDGRS